MKLRDNESENQLCYYVAEDVYHVAERLQREMSQYGEWKFSGSAIGVKQAISEITEHRPHLIFLDWDLVGGSGFEVLQRIQGIRDYHPFIIFNTAFQSDHPEIAEELVNTYKPDAFINKPYWDKLKEQLAGLLNKAKLKSQALEPECKAVWLTDAYGRKCLIEPQHIICVLQSVTNPRSKIFYTEFNLQGKEFIVTWKDIAGMLEENKVDFFITNKRYSLVARKYIESYNKPLIYLKKFNLKVEIVEDYIKEFENWLEK